MNKIEEIKAAKDGLDVLEDLRRYARERTPVEQMDPGDLERMKWYGVFHRRLTPGYFMMRLRVTGGKLTADQADAIANVADEFGRGTLDLTTRQNIQLRWLTIDVIPTVIERLQAAGISTMQTGQDNLRNYVTCPLAGIDASEVVDTRPILMELAKRHLGHREFSNLPRKFNFSVTGCLEDCGHTQTQDLGLVPALKRVDGEHVVGFNVLVGGSLGGTEPKLAEPMDVFVLPQQVPGFVLSVLRVFRDYGPREVRTKARIRWLIAQWGMERFRTAVEEAFGEPLWREGRHLTTRPGGDHLGVRPQRVQGMYSVGVHVPVGRMTAKQLRELAWVARRYGSSELRLTNDQNLLIVNVPKLHVEPLLEEPVLQELQPYPSSVDRAFVVCTGNDYCHFSLIDTKNRAIELALALKARGVEVPSGTRIHISGCINACGKHHVGDIGLEGTKVRIGDRQAEAAHVFVGGKLQLCGGRLAERYRENVLFEELVDVIVEALPRLHSESSEGTAAENAQEVKV
ncbi:MAG: ferredoxin--nitrite reductase [Chloroflexota bacterium]|nr:ferredoxin--nitrite reductase [Dehalococcoidia bacterium]MDW8046992.1 ferredoxin--nitrite reductase [Chloroflexota bacterium]